MLAKIRASTDDRVVLISNYTQTLDLFEELCKKRNYRFVRLDGSLSTIKRQKLVASLNDPTVILFEINLILKFVVF